MKAVTVKDQTYLDVRNKRLNNKIKLIGRILLNQQFISVQKRSIVSVESIVRSQISLDNQEILDLIEQTYSEKMQKILKKKKFADLPETIGSSINQSVVDDKNAEPNESIQGPDATQTFDQQTYCTLADCFLQDNPRMFA